jgi:hypothetical protein
VPVPFAEKKFRYFLHLVGGLTGIKDLAGNSLDFQSQVQVQDFLVIPFSVDTRKRQVGEPYYPDNLVVNIVRRYENEDEDEQPSLYLPGEIPPAGGQVAPAEAYPQADVFGAVVYVTGGKLAARPAARVTKVVDDLNQQPPAAQTSDLRFCPESVGGEPQVATNTAAVRFGAAIQNPLNPFGSRLQTLWREIDMSLSRVDPFDYDLDVEQMYWAPFATGPITYDQFDRVSLFLGHSEFRPEPCVGAFSALPSLPNSGLGVKFVDNYAHNLTVNTGEREDDPGPHPAYQDKPLTIDSALAFTEQNGINRYLPLPTFDKPYFVWRDQTSKLQGGNSGVGSDVRNANQNVSPYIISPWLTGGGRLVTLNNGNLRFNRGFWSNFQEFWLLQTTRRDTFTGGGLGSIALPLLADFWTYCDDPDLPANNGFVATGFNGWQIALTVQSAPTPNFRAFSAGFAGIGARPPICVDPSTPAWTTASGGYDPNGNRTSSSTDNSLYWIMADFMKRQSVVTAGFVDVANPHRMPNRLRLEGDPRLGPYFPDSQGRPALPTGFVPFYDYVFEPPLDSLPGGTAVVAEFRAASIVDPEPWRWSQLPATIKPVQPDEINFPLDPLKACDAHMRKFDDRLVNGRARSYWAYYYNRQVTDYTTDIANLSRDQFTSQFVGANETFRASDVRYFNWRFIMRNNVDATPPVSPSIESFAVAYRFEKQ